MCKEENNHLFLKYPDAKDNPFMNEERRIIVSDNYLIEKCLCPNEQERDWAWKAICYIYGNRLYRNLRRKTREEADAKDIVQDALAQLKDNPRTVVDKPILFWLCKTGNNLLADKIKDTKQEVSMDASVLDIIAPPSEDQEELEEQEQILKQLSQRINSLLKTLRDPDRLTLKVLYLRYWQLENETKELRLIALRSHDPDDTAIKVLGRIINMRQKQAGEENEISQIENTLKRLLHQLNELSEQKVLKEKELEAIRSSTGQNVQKVTEELNAIDARISRIETRRVKLIEEHKKKIYATTRRKDMACILGEPIGTVLARVSRLEEKIEDFLQECNKN